MKQTDSRPEPIPEFVNSLDSEKDWQRMMSKPLTSSFANTETVKVIVDVRHVSSHAVRNCVF